MAAGSRGKRPRNTRYLVCVDSSAANLADSLMAIGATAEAVSIPEGKISSNNVNRLVCQIKEAIMSLKPDTVVLIGLERAEPVPLDLRRYFVRRCAPYVPLKIRR
jgi:hypothetical protein